MTNNLRSRRARRMYGRGVGLLFAAVPLVLFALSMLLGSGFTLDWNTTGGALMGSVVIWAVGVCVAALVTLLLAGGVERRDVALAAAQQAALAGAAEPRGARPGWVEVNGDGDRTWPGWGDVNGDDPAPAEHEKGSPAMAGQTAGGVA